MTQILKTALPTSKMELFVTIGICKVVFCRLIILYVHYWHSMSVFFVCQLVAGSRWFHLQTSEMLPFVTIASAIVFYWLMILHAPVLPMNFFFLCQFVPESISLKVVPDCSRWFQLVPGGFSSFQVILARPRLFQVVPGRFWF